MASASASASSPRAVVEGAGVQVRVGRRQGALGAQVRVGGQRDRPLQQRCGRRHSPACLGPARRLARAAAATSSSGPVAAAARCQIRRSGLAGDTRASASARGPYGARRRCRRRRRPSAPADAGTAPARRSRAAVPPRAGAAASGPSPGAAPPATAGSRRRSGRPPPAASAAGRLGQARDPPDVVVVEVPDTRRLGGTRTRRAARAWPRRAQLEQRQRVAAGLGDDPVAHLAVQVAGHHVGEQRDGVLVGQPLEGEPGESGEQPIVRPARGPRTPSAPTPRAAGARRTRAPGRTPRRATGRRRPGRPAAARPPPRRAGPARPDRPRTGRALLPAPCPNATCSARACGSGRRSTRSSIGAQSWCSAANGSSSSDSTPAIAGHPAPGGRARDVVQQGCLADAGLAPQHQHRALAAADASQRLVQAGALCLTTAEDGGLCGHLATLVPCPPVPTPFSCCAVYRPARVPAPTPLLSSALASSYGLPACCGDGQTARGDAAHRCDRPCACGADRRLRVPQRWRGDRAGVARRRGRLAVHSRGSTPPACWGRF